MTNNANAQPSPVANLLTVKQVAELLQIGTNRVYDLAREGKIPHLRVGQSYRFSAAVLWGWIETTSSESLKG